MLVFKHLKILFLIHYKPNKTILYTEKYEWFPGHIWIPKR
jgi:hypothetical protein